jgi:uncharacterized protein YndB with AHSA1/START domain
VIDEMAGAIEVTQQIDAPPEIVFSFLTDSARFTRWMGVGAQLDARPGGAYRIDVDGEHVAIGEYREIDPPRRLLMSWGWQGHPDVPPGSTSVEITLFPEKGGTLLRLRHMGLPNSHEREQHTAGWTLYTSRLREAAAR